MIATANNTLLHHIITTPSTKFHQRDVSQQRRVHGALIKINGQWLARYASSIQRSNLRAPPQSDLLGDSARSEIRPC
jgi:hypothetical protein